MFKDPKQIAEFLKKCGYTETFVEKDAKTELKTSKDIKNGDNPNLKVKSPK